MNPNVDIKTDNHEVLTFTMSNINVSLANALRRTILADIPIIIIRSHPYEKNDVIIHRNTSRLNNEILKQRLSSIPIYIRDRLTLKDLSEYEVEIDKKKMRFIGVQSKNRKEVNIINLANMHIKTTMVTFYEQDMMNDE